MLINSLSIDQTEVQCYVPAPNPLYPYGSKNVTLFNYGISSKVLTFTYIEPPTLIQISPKGGQKD
jgi:hypothetical protein